MLNVKKSVICHKNTDATTQFVLLFQKKIKKVIMRDTAIFRRWLAKAANAPAERPRTHSHREVAVGKTQPSPSKVIFSICAPQ